jgi:acetyl esterase
MSSITGGRPPLGIRLFQALAKEPDWSAMTHDELIALREDVNRKRASRFARLITGFPDRGATIAWHEMVLVGRELRVRVYRPRAVRSERVANAAALPLVLHVHGGGFVGTAAQSDWVNSRIAAQLPAVVVSVEHRLLAPDTPLTAAVDDGWDVLQSVVEHSTDWGIDASRVAVFGESTGAAITALAAVRARQAGYVLRAQVLVNPCADVTPAAFEYDSVRQYADSPTLTMAQMQLFARLAVPRGADPIPLSPLHSADLSDLAPALVVVPTIDPVADHGRAYADRLRKAGTPAQLSEYQGATHAFLSMPGLVRQARPACAEITDFLRDHLHSVARSR